MRGLLLQDFTTVLATVGGLTQSESGWLDLAGYRDVVFWLDVRETAASSQLLYQTAPAKDDSLFATIATISPVSVGITTTAVLQDFAAVPVARWIRWQLTGANADIMFRIWVSANKPGRRNLSRQ